MNRGKRAAFVVIVVLQLLVLALMIARRVHLLATGERVLLRCAPVDPRSLLSGDYVRLNFAISNFSEQKLARLNAGRESFREHDTIYVALEPAVGGAPRRAAAVSHDLTDLRRRFPVVLRGTVHSEGWRGGLGVRYGVEEYFVPQGQGLRIEREMGNVAVEVAVARSGESALRRLFIDGQEVRFR